MIDLASVADALDAFPDWDENMRAEVYHTIDVAPVGPIGPGGQSKEYFEGEAHAAWMRIREYVLAPNDGKQWAVTLDEAAGGESAPTRDEILRALERGARMIR